MRPGTDLQWVDIRQQTRDEAGRSATDDIRADQEPERAMTIRGNRRSSVCMSAVCCRAHPLTSRTSILCIRFKQGPWTGGGSPLSTGAARRQ